MARVLAPAVVIDLDGTLCDNSERVKMLDRTNPDWDAYSIACGQDKLIEGVAQMVHSLDHSVRRIFLTGRQEIARPQTRRWLRDVAGLEPRVLIMRPQGDHRPNEVFKEEQILALCQAFHILFVVDDHPEVIKVCQKHNIPAIHVVGVDEAWNGFHSTSQTESKENCNG